jgi:hypothetical protein
MKSYVVAFATFLAFNAVKNVVLRPIATSMNMPLLTTIVS